MLGIFTQNPIELQTLQFLIKARDKFEPLAKRCEKKQKNPNKKIIAYGGEAPLYDIYQIIIRLFAQDREAGETVITKLRPHCYTESETNEATLKLNRTLMILCNQAAIVNRDIKWLYTQIDTEKKGKLTYTEFTNNVRDSMGLWITKEDCIAICRFIDSDNTGVINYKNFSRIPFKNITHTVSDKRWFVHKCDFLYTILGEVEIRRQADYRQLVEIFIKYDDNGDGVLTLEEFTELIKSLDPEKESEFIVTMFRKALDLEMDVENLDKLSPASFVELALRENLGGYGKNAFEEITIAEELLEISMKKLGKNDKANPKAKGSVWDNIAQKIKR